MNQAAKYNFTKDIEMCIIGRHPGATLAEFCNTTVVAASKQPNESNPFAKPMQAWDILIKAISRPQQTILDPFCGEGSSLQAFISNWRVFVGIEINEKHYNVALNRVKERLDLQYRKPRYV
jgi:DNA modification methylase